MSRFAAAALLVAFVVTAAPPAAAQVVDLSTLTCKEFFEGPEDRISYVVMWLDGYYQEEDSPPVVDFDNMRSRIEALAAYCATHQETGLITAADETL